MNVGFNMAEYRYFGGGTGAELTRPAPRRSSWQREADRVSIKFFLRRLPRKRAPAASPMASVATEAGSGTPFGVGFGMSTVRPSGTFTLKGEPELAETSNV